MKKRSKGKSWVDRLHEQQEKTKGKDGKEKDVAPQKQANKDLPKEAGKCSKVFKRQKMFISFITELVLTEAW